MNSRLFSQYCIDIKKLIRIATPIGLAQLAQTGMGTVDVIMAGRVSSADVGGVGIGASIWLPLVLFGQGLLLALPPTISYLNGSGQRHRIAHQVRQGLWISFLVMIPLALIIYHNDFILQFMNMDAHMADVTMNYLRAMVWGLPAYLLLINFRCLNDGIAKTKTGHGDYLHGVNAEHSAELYVYLRQIWCTCVGRCRLWCGNGYCQLGDGNLDDYLFSQKTITNVV